MPDTVALAMLMLFVLPATASIPHPHRQPRQVVHIIQKLEQRFQQAQIDGNTAIMASMLSDDYLGIYSDGTLATKAETLAAFKNHSTHFTSINTFDRKIRVYGSTVVVTSKARVVGVNDGDQITGDYRYTRVYHRTDRVWRIVSFEASKLHQKHNLQG